MFANQFYKFPSSRPHLKNNRVMTKPNTGSNLQTSIWMKYIIIIIEIRNWFKKAMASFKLQNLLMVGYQQELKKRSSSSFNTSSHILTESKSPTWASSRLCCSLGLEMGLISESAITTR